VGGKRPQLMFPHQDTFSERVRILSQRPYESVDPSKGLNPHTPPFSLLLFLIKYCRFQQGASPRPWRRRTAGGRVWTASPRRPRIITSA
jgi:hypothetical protein